ncbi:hypothetical protein GQF42_40500 [Streptomyces broussonetiae]|uniref:Uncharacterized protein n=2 Tax=Streptomyces broussonetiae TaxID=2686304 RepID=A0A6I6NIB0_9ACTN|nr:hypothetical protein [Streptomyces broussonetiae]QHA08715.1 hypothetical protein GQF42_40500 [Streptomyces broussonetiae]
MSLGRRHQGSVIGTHLNMVPFSEPESTDDPTETERAAPDRITEHPARRTPAVAGRVRC